ncbi:MAG: LysR family transcriptional regulator [Gammaproteobacteria bacterium]|nr:LysR family transcriptional regulator [Gammaproteobacteria bacterium]
MVLPPVTELTYFYEVAKVANFSRAAIKLHTSQPSLSMAIKRLETTLNTTLFYRRKQGLILTRAGIELFQYVKDLLHKWEDIRSHVVSSHQEIKGSVTIGCNATLIPFVGTIFSNLLRQFPALEVHMQNERSQKITEWVTDATVDIGIVLNPVAQPDLIIRKISTTDLSFWSSTNTSNQQNLLSGQAVIICDPTILQTKALLKKLEKDYHGYAHVSHSNSLEAIAHFVMNGYGVGILPSCFAQAFYAESLQRINDAPFYGNDLCLIYRHEDKEVAAIQAVLSGIKEFIALNSGVKK